MVTLSGTRTSPGINYYTTDSVTVDLGTTGFQPGSTLTVRLQATAWTITDQIGFDVALHRASPDSQNCMHATYITPSGNNGAEQTQTWSPYNSGVEWTGAANATGCMDFSRITFGIRTYQYPGSSSVTWTWSVTYSPVAGAICAYGTEHNPAAEPYAFITGALVDAAVIAMGGGALAVVAFDALIGAPFIGPTCDANPVMPPAITSDDFLPGTVIPKPGSLGTFKDNLVYSLWGFFCQCKSGTSGDPPPTPPPPITLPPELQPTPHTQPDCSANDPCTRLTNIENILTTINVNLNYPRYATPSGKYQLGTTHPGISGNGVLAVSGILGVLVSVTIEPDRTGVTQGTPQTLWDLGWINVGDANGFQARQFISTASWLYFPPSSSNVSQIGYSIPDDVEVAITELVALP